MSTVPNVRIDQPREGDVVGNPVMIAGLATGFEGDVRARVIDANGTVLAEGGVQAGSMGMLAPFQTQLSLDGEPASAEGSVQVYSPSPRGEPGDELAGLVSVSITFESR
jgi:hypothetical protein